MSNKDQFYTRVVRLRVVRTRFSCIICVLKLQSLTCYKDFYNSSISMISGNYFEESIAENPFTCMAAKVDEKSLQCSRKTLSFAVTFMSSAVKEFMFSTCQQQTDLDILAGEILHIQTCYTN